jgi:hypothetical protein
MLSLLSDPLSSQLFPSTLVQRPIIAFHNLGKLGNLLGRHLNRRLHHRPQDVGVQGGVVSEPS